MRINCLILIEKTTGNCVMSQNEAKMAWNPAPVLLRCPKTLLTSSKKADVVNPTDTFCWHVTYLNRTACRNKYISTSQQINTKYGSYLHVCSSSNLNNIKILSALL